MIIIDAHCHILPPELIAARQQIAAREPWFGEVYRNEKNKIASADDLIRSMARAQVDQSVIFGFAFKDPQLCRLCNQYILEVARQYPGKLLPFVVVQPCAPEGAQRELIDCMNAGALGLGELLPDGQCFTLDDWKLLDPIMKYMHTVKRPVMFHLNEQLGHEYRGKGRHGPVAGYALGLRYHANKIILSHWGGGLPFYELMPEIRLALQNVYYDTAASALLYDDRIFASALSWMPDKILWGSDYPLLGQKRFIQRIQALGLPLDQLERLFWQNTTHVLSLQQPVAELEPQ